MLRPDKVKVMIIFLPEILTFIKEVASVWEIILYDIKVFALRPR